MHDAAPRSREVITQGPQTPPPREGRRRPPRPAGIGLGIAGVLVGLLATAVAEEPPANPFPPLADWQLQTWTLEHPDSPALARLPDGALVLGDAAGLTRFDGRGWTRLPLPPGRTTVRLLQLDRSGVLHAVRADGTHHGVEANTHWTVSDCGPPPGEGTEGPLPTTICEAQDGAIWIGHRNGIVSRTVGRRVEWVPTHSERTTASEPAVHVVADTRGRVWMARKGCLAVWEEGRWEPRQSLTSSALTLAPARDGGLWVRMGGPVYHFDETRGLERAFAGEVPTIRTLAEDPAGRLWMGTSRTGLVCWDGQRLAKASTAGSSIFSLLEAGPDGLWVRTTAGLEHGGPRIVHQLSMPTVKPLLSVCATPAGAFVFLTVDGVVGCRLPDGSAAPLPAVASGSVTALAAGAGEVWLGLRGGGVLRLATPTAAAGERLPAPPGCDALPVQALAPVGDQGLWAASGPHLHAWMPTTGWRRSTQPASRGEAPITVLAADAEGGVWAATAAGDISHTPAPGPGTGDLAGESRTPPNLPHGAVVTAICPLADGTTWIATRAAGLWRWRAGTWNRLDTTHGLPSATLVAAVPDDEGRLWCAGRREFFVASLADLDAVAAGRRSRCHCWLVTPEAERVFFDPGVMPPGIAFRDATGRPLVMLPTGIAVCEPGRFPPAAAAPVVAVSEVRADGRAVGPPPGPGYAHRPQAAIVPAGTRLVTFAVSGCDPGWPTNVRLQHLLEGVDADWADTPSDGIIRVERPPAGRLRLRLRTTTDADVWQTDAPSLVVDVEPWFWDRPWVRGAAGLIVVGGAAALAFNWASWRSSLALARAQQLAAVEGERIRLARDMHDELGTSLTQISLLTESIRAQAAADTANQLDDVTAIARATVEALDEIVWAVKPGNDTLAHLLSYVAIHTSQTLSRLGINCVLDLPDAIPPGPAPTDFRRTVLAIVKEAVANVLRHAGAGEVRFAVRVTGGRLRLVIADDGRGLAAAPAAPRPRAAAGIDNMRDRAGELGGHCTVATAAGGGTVVTLDVPLPAGG